MQHLLADMLRTASWEITESTPTNSCENFTKIATACTRQEYIVAVGYNYGNSTFWRK
jgi:hypothetical protein